MKRAAFQLIIFLATLLALNLALSARTVQALILRLNPLDYFYTGHDWILKLAALRDLRDPTPAVAIGTSRTALLLNPEVIPLQNLGLIAASYEQVALMARDMARSGRRFPVVFIEVNAIALSERFRRHTAIADYNSLFSKPDPLLESAVGRTLFRQVPLLRYRYLLADVFRQAGTYENPLPKEIRNLKRDFHLRQFFGVDQDSQRGYVPSPPVQDPELRKLLLESCVSTSTWALSRYEPQSGLKELRKAIDYLIPVSDLIILWVPPKSSEWESPLEVSARERVLKTVLSWKLPLINLSDDKASESWFNDCIHASSEGARHYSRILQKEWKKYE